MPVLAANVLVLAIGAKFRNDAEALAAVTSARATRRTSESCIRQENILPKLSQKFSSSMTSTMTAQARHVVPGAGSPQSAHALLGVRKLTLRDDVEQSGFHRGLMLVADEQGRAARRIERCVGEDAPRLAGASLRAAGGILVTT